VTILREVDGILVVQRGAGIFVIVQVSAERRSLAMEGEITEAHGAAAGKQGEEGV
jgi:hypothetical protein